MQISENYISFDNALAVLAQGEKAIAAGDDVIDMCNVQKTDSSAVALVLAWMRTCQKSGRSLRISNTPESFQKLVRLYGLGDIIK